MPNRHKASRPAIRRTVLALACASFATVAWSQEDTTNQPAAQKIEVTGSRIKRIDAEGASPVQVLKREDIQRTGATTVREMLETLSSNSSAGSLTDIGGSNSFSPGASSASLRNLGKQSTLVLLNSRRVAAYPLADYSEVFSNIDTLPLDAIERIEILKSGGSALYGSDAVAGVINIITRSNFNGLQANINAQQSLQNGEYGSRGASLTGGFGDLGADGYNLLANVEFYQRDGSFWRDVFDDANPYYNNYSSRYGAPSTYGYPGWVNGVALDGCKDVDAAGFCSYDRLARLEVTPPTERTNLLVSGKARLGEMTAFGEVLYSHIAASYNSAYQAYGPFVGAPLQWGDPDTKEIKTFYYHGLPAHHPLNPSDEEVDFRYRFADGPSYEKTETNQYRVLGGLQGAFGEYDWEVAAGMMGGSTKDRQRGAFSDSGFVEMIGDYSNPDAAPADFFNKPGGYRIAQPNSKAVIDRLFPEFGYEAKITQTFLDGKVTTDLAKWDSGTVGLATGFDLRHERAEITPSHNLLSGDIVGFGVSASDASRNYGAVFAEVSLPILKTLEAQVAGRVDRFPGFDAHFSPKLGLRFQPVPEFLLRGTFEGGFRAPNLTESAKSTKYSFEPGISDPQRCPQAIQLRQDLIDQAAGLPDTDPNKAQLLIRAENVVGNECDRSAFTITSNNPALKPETSRSWTLGVALQPLRHWSVTMDYWNIHRRNEISQRGTQDLLAVENSLPAGTLTRSPLTNDPTFSQAEQAQYGVSKGSLASVTSIFENLFQTKTSGVDLSVKGEFPTPVGPLSLDIDGTYTSNYQAWSEALNGYGDNLAGRYGFPRWVLGVTTGLRTGSFDQSLRLVWNTSTRLQLDYNDDTWSPAACATNGVAPEDCRVREYERWDYSLAYSGVKNMVVGFNIRNVFNQRPPVDVRAFGLGGVLPPDRTDPQGRMMKVFLQYKFL